MAQTLAVGDDTGTGATRSVRQSVLLGAWAHRAVILCGEHLAGSPSLQQHQPGRGFMPAGFGLTELYCLIGTRLFILCLPTHTPSHDQRPTPRLPSRELASSPPCPSCIYPSLHQQFIALHIHLLLCRFLSQPWSLSLEDATTFLRPTLAPKLLSNTTDQISPLPAQPSSHRLVSS